jgi:hypothetical protein
MFMLEGDRGISGDTVAEPGAMVKGSQAVNLSPRGGVLSMVLKKGKRRPFKRATAILHHFPATLWLA